MSSEQRDLRGAAEVEVKIANTVNGIVALEDWLQTIQTSLAIPNDTLFAIKLCLEEALTNIVNHAYEDGSEHEISVRLMRQPDGLTFEIIDDGKAFDPLEATPPRKATDLATTQPGGLGINLIREFSERLDYERRDGCNRLRIGFSIA